MNAGAMNIAILADYSQFLQQLQTLKTVAEKDAKSIGDTVSRAVSAAIKVPQPVSKPIVEQMEETVKLIDPPLTELEMKLKTRLKQAGASSGAALGGSLGAELKAKLSEQMRGALITAIGIQTADKLLKAFASTIRGESGLMKALEEVLLSVPLLGAAYQVGEAIGGQIVKGYESLVDPHKMARRGTDIAYMEEVDARNKAEADAKAAGQRAAYELAGRIAMERRHVDSIEKDLKERQDARAIAAAKNRMDEVQVLEIEYRRAMERLQQEEYSALGPLVYDDEAYARANAVIEERRRLIEEEFAERRAAVEEEMNQRQMALDEEARKRDEMAAAEQEKRDKEIQHRLDAARAEIIEMEGMRVSSARGGIGTAGTAIGSFTFDAYPDSQKKANDERMIDHLAGIHRRMETSGIN